MDTESIDKGVSQDGRHWPGRVDWRSGKTAYLRDDAFRQAQEQRRLEQGLSVSKYCQANDLALSTYRHRLRPEGRCASRRQRQASRSPAVTPKAPLQGDARFVPIDALACAATRPGDAAEAEIHTPQGLVIRLAGAAAAELLQRLVRALP